MILVILYIVVVLPFRIAFVNNESTRWTIANYSIDILFLIDMILTFNTCYYNEELCQMIQTHKKIAISYLKGWFVLDLLSIFPIEAVITAAINNPDKKQGHRNINSIARLSRVGRLYKLVRFIRMAKLMRVFKSRRKITRNLGNFLSISAGKERMVFFIFFLLMFTHISACLWVLLASRNPESSWLAI